MFVNIGKQFFLRCVKMERNDVENCCLNSYAKILVTNILFQELFCYYTNLKREVVLNGCLSN